MDKDKIKSAVEKYIKDDLKTDYALMITGEWGAGKTYFLKKDLFDLFRAKKKKPIYISLISVSSLESLKEGMFSKINPFYKNNQIYSKAQNEGIYLENLLTNKDDVLSLIPSHIILCFDDLERIEPSFLEEAIGYVNSFVEHSANKAIFLCNDKKLEDKEKFEQIKEKYFRYSFCFEGNIEDVINEMDMKLPIDKELILEVYERFLNNNIRTFLYSINIFSDIYNDIKEDLNKFEYKDYILKGINFFILIWAIKLKSNDKFLQDLEDISKNFNTIIPFEDEDNSLWDKIHGLLQKIEEGQIVFFHFQSIVNCLREKGYCDKVELVSEIELANNEYVRRRELADKEKVESYKYTKERKVLDALNSASELTEDTYNALYRDIITGLKENIFSANVIIRIYSLLLHLDSYDIEYVKLPDDLIEIFKDSMKSVINETKRDLHPYSNHYYWGDNSEQAERLKEFVDFTYNLLETEEIKKQKLAIDDIFERLKADEEISIDDFKEIDSDEWNNIRNINQFFEILKKTSGVNVNNFIDFLTNKYRIRDSVIPSEIRIEKEFIKKLHFLTDEYIETCKLRDFKIIAFTVLRKVLNEIIVKYLQYE